MMNNAYDSIIKKSKLSTFESVKSRQRTLIPFMNKCRMLNTDRYRYRGRTYVYKYSADFPDETFGIISVEDMPYYPNAVYRSDQSFIYRLDSMILNHKVAPILLFVNGRFVNWDNIYVIFDCGKTWLKLYGDRYNYYNITKINMMVIPFEISYLSKEDDLLFDKYYDYMCKYINESARVRTIGTTKRLVIKIPRLNDIYKTSDNETIEIGIWYYNQLKLYFTGLLDKNKIDKLKKISVTKLNHNDDGTFDRNYSTSVNLLDEDSINQAQLSFVMSMSPETIESKTLFRFNSDGILDYDSNDTIITKLDDYDLPRDNPKNDIIIRRKTYSLHPNESTDMNYDNADIDNILFRDNYIVFRNGMLCNGTDNIKIGNYIDEENFIPTNGYKVINKFGSVESNDGTNDIIDNNEWTIDGELVEPDDNKTYNLDVFTFYDDRLRQINTLFYKVPNKNLLTPNCKSDKIKEYFTENKNRYLQYLLQPLSYKYGNNIPKETNYQTAFDSIINYDLSEFDELYEPLLNYKSYSMTGEYVNNNLVYDGYFRDDRFLYTLCIPLMQFQYYECYAMVFVNGIFIDNYNCAKLSANKLYIPINEKFNNTDTIEVLYFLNCNNNEIQFTLENEDGNINRHIQFDYFNSEEIKIFTGEFQLDKELLTYPGMEYDEKEISFKIDHSLTETRKTEIDFNTIYDSKLFGKFKILEELPSINDNRYVMIKFIDSGYERPERLDKILSTLSEKVSYEITLENDNEELLCNKPLIIASQNKFIYQRFDTDDKCYKIKLDKRFRYCDNQLQYMIFVNGRKLNHYDYLITIPKLSRPFDEIYLYTSRFIDPGDRVDIFYTPIKCNDFAFDNEMEIKSDGFIKLSKDSILYPFMSDAYWVSINGKKICKEDIITMDSTLFKISKDYNSLQNLSIIPLIEENPYQELNDYFHGINSDNDCYWDKAIDMIYTSSLPDIQNGNQNLISLLFNTSNIINDAEENYLSIDVGRIAIINEIVRDFWVSNGFDYNKDVFTYDYYTNDDYNAIYYDEKTSSYILPALDANLKGVDKNNEEQFLNIAKNDIYHLYFICTYAYNNGSNETAHGTDKYIEIGTQILNLKFTWEYNNFYNQLSLNYQKLYDCESTGLIEDPIDTKKNYITINNDLREYIQITKHLNLDGVDPSKRYYKFRIKSSDGYSVYNSYCELEFVNAMYYGLIDEDKLDKRESDIYSDDPQSLVEALTNKILNKNGELNIDNYKLENYMYFVFAVPKRYIYNTDGAKLVEFYLPELNDEFIKNNTSKDQAMVNAPIYTDGTYIDGEKNDESDNHDIHFINNLKPIKEFKLEEFKEFDFINKYGYSEPYLIFKSNGFFIKLNDNNSVNIHVKLINDEH